MIWAFTKGSIKHLMPVRINQLGYKALMRLAPDNKNSLVSVMKQALRIRLKGKTLLPVLLALFVLMQPAAPLALQNPITGNDGTTMFLIPEGEFVMGSSERDLKKESPEHKVYVDAFYMDKYEVTNRLFSIFLSDVKPSLAKDGERWQWIVLRSDLDMKDRAEWWPTEIVYEAETGMYLAFEGFEKYPVISVSWHAADAYCKWAGKTLPTEAQWERAARGGLQGKSFPWGNEIPTGGLVFEKRWSSNGEPAPTEEVGNYHPNAYGLFDMAGNVWEWCSDWYSDRAYKKSKHKNPQGPKYGNSKVLRGGSWYNQAIVLRVAVRNFNNPYGTDDAVGFRCVLDALKALDNNEDENEMKTKANKDKNK